MSLSLSCQRNKSFYEKSFLFSYILRDVRPHIPKGYCYTLHDVGLVINKLMGGAYRSYYTRRKFRPIYAKVMNSYVNTHRKPSTFQRTSGVNSMSLITGLLPFTSDMALFEFPFNELLVSLSLKESC